MVCHSAGTVPEHSVTLKRPTCLSPSLQYTQPQCVTLSGVAGRQLHVVHSGCACPSPIDEGPAARRSPLSFPPRSESKKKPLLSTSTSGTAAPSAANFYRARESISVCPSPSTSLPWQILQEAVAPNQTGPRVKGICKPLHQVDVNSLLVLFFLFWYLVECYTYTAVFQEMPQHLNS